MISTRLTKPVLVAGFFIFTHQVGAQSFEFQEAQAPSSVVPYVQADMSGVPLNPEPLANTSSDARSLAIRVQQLEEEIRRLNGLVEEQASLLMRLQDQSLERYVEVDRRLAMIASGEGVKVTDDPISPADTVAVGESNVAPEESLKAPQMGEQEAYQAAYGLVRERQFSDALTAFAAFLGEYPFGRFAPNAHYWLGELYLVVEPVDPESARQNFQVHALKGNQERSREYLQRVISEYGADGHPAAQLAKDFLDSQ
jgi:TolA-binding protein